MNLLEIMINQSNILYSCVLLDEPSKQLIISRINIPDDWKIINHHMTITLGELPHEMKNRIGEVIELPVNRIGISDLALALGVDTDVCLKPNPHITVAINDKNGGKPKHSNDIENWVSMIQPFKVKGTITEVSK